MMEPQKSPKEILCKEILAQARADAEEIYRQAETEAGKILKRAAEAAERARRELLETARADAAGRKEFMLAAVPAEAARLRSDRAEALLQAIRAESARRLSVPPGGTFERKQILIALASEAAGRIGGAVTLKLSPADFRGQGPGLAAEVAARAARDAGDISVVEDLSVADGGVIIRSASGRQIWDNRLSSRLERMWPELRRLAAVRTGLAYPGPAGGGK